MRHPLFTIILPTLNEKDNIAPIIEGLELSLKEYQGRYEIIFADDSTDDTPVEIWRFSSINEHISYIHRSPDERTGLGTAFVNAFKFAKGKYIVCMDSDLQHPPEKVPEFIKVLGKRERYCDCYTILCRRRCFWPGQSI